MTNVRSEYLSAMQSRAGNVSGVGRARMAASVSNSGTPSAASVTRHRSPDQPVHKVTSITESIGYKFIALKRFRHRDHLLNLSSSASRLCVLVTAVHMLRSSLTVCV